jgi:hypothetical protein
LSLLRAGCGWCHQGQGGLLAA